MKEHLKAVLFDFHAVFDFQHFRSNFRIVEVHAFKNLHRAVFKALEKQPARALRQEQNSCEHHGCRNGDDSQHDAPVASRDSTERGIARKPCVAEKGEHDADGDHQLIHRDHRAADRPRRDFGEIKRGRKGGDAHRDAEEKPRDDQHFFIMRQRAGQRADNKNHGAHEDRASASKMA